MPESRPAAIRASVLRVAMPSDAQTLAIQFPLKGMDTTSEFGTQPDGTSPLAKNSRAIEPDKSRNRGGSRHGISKYAPTRLGVTSHLIQHLAVIVDPTVEATLSEEETDVWFLDRRGMKDPSNRGRGKRYVRTGGSGVRYRKRKNAPDAVSDSLSATPGGAPVAVNVVTNDTYAGTPTVALGYIPPSLRGTLSLVGTTVTYTPPADGDAGAWSIPYRITATGNEGRDYASINISLEPAGMTEGQLTWQRYVAGDGFWFLDVSIIKYNGVLISDTRIQFNSDPLYFAEGAINVLYQGPYPPTFDDGGPGAPDSGINGLLNVYDVSDPDNPKATVELNGHAYGDEV